MAKMISKMRRGAWCTVRAAILCVVLPSIMSSVAQGQGQQRAQPAPQLQSPISDSAAIYERLANTDLAEYNAGAMFFKPQNARRAHALYTARGDERGQARTLLIISNAFGGDRQLDSAFAYTKRALAIFERTRADSAEWAEALGNVSQSLMMTMGPLDSAVAYRVRSLALAKRVRGPVKWPALYAGFAEGFRVREHEDPALHGKPEVLDSALHYYHASLKAVRSRQDSLESFGIFGLISNIWLTRGQLDSGLVYRQRSYVNSRRSDIVEQVIYDAGSISGIFLNAPVRDRSKGVVRNLDSALAWGRVTLEYAKRFTLPHQQRSALTLATLFQRVGQPDSARVYMQWAINNAVRAKNAQHEAGALASLAGWYSRYGYADSALALYQTAERQATSRATPRTNAAVMTQLGAFLSLAGAHMTRGNIDSAMYWRQRALEGTASDSTLWSYRLGALEGIANVLDWRGQPDSAGALYRRIEREAAVARGHGPAIEIWQRVALNGQAHSKYDLGQLDSARILFERVLAVASGPVNQPSPAALVSPLASLASIQRLRGRPDSAITLDRRALAIAVEQSLSTAEAEAHQALGEDFATRGVPDSALMHFRAAVTLHAKSAFRARTIESLGMLASWYVKIDIADSAVALNRRAASMAAGLSIPSIAASIRYRTGIAYGALGQWDSSVVNLEASIGLRGHASPGTLAALGGIRLRMGETDSATVLVQAALRAYRATNSGAGIAMTAVSLSHIEVLRGRPDTALTLAREALVLSQRAQDKLTEGRAIAAMGRAQFALARGDSAMLLYASALQVFRDAGFTREARETLAELAEMLRKRRGSGDLSLATVYFDSASATVDNARRRSGDDENAVAFSEAQTDLYGGWARAWLGRGTELGASRVALAALGAVERGRAQALLDLIRRDPTVTRETETRAGRDLSLEADSVLAGVRAARAAALSYLHSGDTLFTWFVSPDGAVEVLPPQEISSRELGRLVRSARRHFMADDARGGVVDPEEVEVDVDSTMARMDPAEDLRRLARLLLPVDFRERVPAGTPVVVVPHGTIALVPFAALETRETATASRAAGGEGRGRAASDTVRDGALGIRNPLRYAPSFAALRATEALPRLVARGRPNRARAGQSRGAVSMNGTSARETSGTRTALAGALVVGNPTMPFLYSGRNANRAQLRPLPGAEAESRTIALLLGARVVTGPAATETLVRNRMSSAPLIHFATHGLGYGAAATARRSYIAFAADSAQDGLLTLGELMDDRKLRLRAELVVLSACQTGLGDMKRAEGSIGLQRAFLSKGARSVLVSLWNVDDRATRLLMESFYTAWLDPLTPRTKAVALQLAQDAVRRTPGYAHPKYWAAFQLVGAD